MQTRPFLTECGMTELDITQTRLDQNLSLAPYPCAEILQYMSLSNSSITPSYGKMKFFIPATCSEKRWLSGPFPLSILGRTSVTVSGTGLRGAEGAASLGNFPGHRPIHAARHYE